MSPPGMTRRTRPKGMAKKTSGQRGPVIAVEATLRVKLGMRASNADRDKKLSLLVQERIEELDLPEGYEIESFTAGILTPYPCAGDINQVPGEDPIKCGMPVANEVNGLKLCLDHTFGEMQKIKHGETLEVKATPKGTLEPLRVDMILPFKYWPAPPPTSAELQAAAEKEDEDGED